MINWRPAQLIDIDAMIELSQHCYELELDNLLTSNPARLACNLAHAVINRNFNSGSQLIQTAWDQERLVAWTWMGRGAGTDYTDEATAEAHILHVDLTLPASTRVRLINQTLDLWISWCEILNIPLLVSTSIRRDYEAFMRLHERKGFQVRGSHAFKRINFKEQQ